MIRSMVFVCGLLLATTVMAENQPPVIKHSPVKNALQGQGIVVRATVKDDGNAVRSVTLYYALTKDMQPYKIVMQDSGSGLYTGTISPDLLSGLTRAFYYVEAKDNVGTISETPWYTVDISTGKAVDAPSTPKGDPGPKEEGSSWVKPALIGVGVVAVGGLAVALSSSGGGGDDSTPTPEPDPGTNTDTNFAGVYSGTATTCFAPPGDNGSCSLSPITITVSDADVVTSDTLREGEHLETTLAGNDFLFVVSVSESNMTGQIEYLGTIVSGRISGSIQGSATSTNGTGTYSGNFTGALP